MYYLSAVAQNFLGPENKRCDSCNNAIPKDNWEVHQMQCSQRMEREKCTELKSGEAKRIAQKPKQTARKKSSKPSRVDQSEDLDKLLAEVTLSDSTCKFSQCSKKVNLLGILCQFCQQRFCMEHSLAEVHGCGDSAKQQSRKDLQREAKQGSRTYYSLSGTKRSQLQTKLAKKLDEKSSERQSKKDTNRKEKR